MYNPIKKNDLSAGTRHRTSRLPQRLSGHRTNTAPWRRAGLNGYQVVERTRPPDDVQASTVIRSSMEHGPLTTHRPQRLSGHRTNTAPWRRAGLNGYQVVERTQPPDDAQSSTVFRSSNEHGPLTTRRPQRLSGRRWNTAPWRRAGINGYQVIERTRPPDDRQASTVIRSSMEHGPLTTCRPQRLSGHRTNTAPWRRAGLNGYQVIERTRPPDDVQSSTDFRLSMEHGPLTTRSPQRFSGRRTKTAPWRRAGLNDVQVFERTRPPDDVQASMGAEIGRARERVGVVE